MAEHVQAALDQMVVPLRDLLDRQIFTHKEIKSIVDRRRSSEYLLRRIAARKADFLRYIEAEQLLERLRQLRVKQRRRDHRKTKNQQQQQQPGDDKNKKGGGGDADNNNNNNNNSNNDVSLRMFCFQLAEFARDAGHPDWFQFTAMVCCLGRILMRTDEEAEKNNGPSYMLKILKNSSVGLPEESFDLLRSFSLHVGDWNNGNVSVHNTKSEKNHSWMDYPRPVMDLYEIIDFAQRQTIHPPTSQRQARSEIQGTAASTFVVVSESHCDELWEEYYSFVAMKYDAMKYLRW